MNHHGDHYVICDLCGGKFRKSQTRIINDRFNTLNKMVVCFADYEKTNPQAFPFVIKERLTRDPQKIRPERPPVFVSNPLSNRLPGAPQHLEATLNPLTLQVQLTWQGPVDTGSDGIIGWYITRAEPQYAYQFLLVENTGNTATIYLDASADTSSNYTYAVAAISSVGVGPFSDLAPYPKQEVQTGINYLAVSQTSIVLATGDGTAIILSVG